VSLLIGILRDAIIAFEDSLHFGIVKLTEMKLNKKKICLVLNIFKKIIPHVVDKNSLGLIYCTAIACLFRLDGEYEDLYHNGLEVIEVLASDLFFSKVNYFQIFFQAILTYLFIGS
jgi:hypothetical protein